MMEEWIEFLSGEFIDAMMWYESPDGDSNHYCATCSAPNANFRCLDCFSPSMTCQPCFVAAHQREALHRMQVSFLSQATSTVLTTLSVEMDWGILHHRIPLQPWHRIPTWPPRWRTLQITLDPNRAHPLQYLRCSHHPHHLLFL